MSVRKWMASASRASLLVSAGNAVKFPGASEIDGDGEKQDDEGPDGDFEGEVFAEDDAADGLRENPDAGGEHEDGFDRG